MLNRKISTRRIYFPRPLIGINSSVSERNRLKFESYKPSYFVLFMETDEKDETALKDLDQMYKQQQEKSLEKPNKAYQGAQCHIPEISPPPRAETRDYDDLNVRESGDNKNNNWPLINLRNIIIKVFKGNNISLEDLNIKYYEFNIVLALLDKKFKNTSFPIATKETFNFAYKKAAIDLINDISFLGISYKRVEENNKFIFKMALNHLRNSFLRIKGLKNNKKGELSFYEYYFKDLADQTGNQFDAFFDPLYKTTLKNKVFKSINTRYLKLLMQSERFKAAFTNFLNIVCREVHEANIVLKVNEFMVYLRQNTQTSKTEEERESLYRVFDDDLRRKRKFKIPWTVHEAENAITQFKNRMKLK